MLRCWRKHKYKKTKRESYFSYYLHKSCRKKGTSSPLFKPMPSKVTPTPINMTSFLEYPNDAFCNNIQKSISIRRLILCFACWCNDAMQWQRWLSNQQISVQVWEYIKEQLCVMKQMRTTRIRSIFRYPNYPHNQKSLNIIYHVTGCSFRRQRHNITYKTVKEASSSIKTWVESKRNGKLHYWSFRY